MIRVVAIILVLIIIVALVFIYWWFIPWRPVLNVPRLPGLKEVNLIPSILFKKEERILVITAHIDDVEFFCGGTLARLQAQDAKIWLVIGTEDYKWYYSSRAASEKNTKTRKQEQEKVAKYFNYQKITYLGYPDFRLKADSTAINRVEKIIKKFKPDAILTFDAIDGPSIQHRDHNEAGKIALKAAQKSDINAKIFMFSTSKPNLYVDVTNTLNHKWAALKMFKSEFRESDFVFRMLKNWASTAGKKSGVSYAESYHVVTFKLDTW